MLALISMENLMTVTVSITAPTGKAAKAVRSDGAEYDVNPGATVQVSIWDDLTVTISEGESLVEGGGTASPQGGGNGTPPPKPPKPGDE